VSGPDFDGWMPFRISAIDGRPVVDWCHIGDEPFREPFFDDTIRACLRKPFNQLFRRRTTLEELGSWHERRPGIAPAGLIFHVSRCGSTLVAQLLASSAAHVVISEAAPIDALLRSPDPAADAGVRARRLQWLVSALAQPRRGTETRCFIKFDSWSVFDLPIITRAFPGVPCLFLRREPAAVIASHLRQRGAHTVPQLIDPRLFGMDPDAATALPPREYIERVVTSLDAALAAAAYATGGLVLDYSELPAAAWERLPAYFGFTLTAAERSAMKEAARFDAKHPAQLFAPALSSVS
jgi:hypothetical protein